MKVYIRTLGCEKNTVDSENAARLLLDAGCSVIDDPEDADVLIVNTCGFIGDAKKQSIEAVFEMNAVKEASGGKKTLIVSGCLTQRYAEELKKSLPEADFILGVNDYDKLPGIVLGNDKERVHAGACEKTYKELGSRKLLTKPWSRSLKIAEGCYNNCSYCIIPYTRGRILSLPAERAVSEAKELAEKGYREIVLTGIEIASYGLDLKDRISLKDIVFAVSEAVPDVRIRLGSIEPTAITEDFCRTLSNCINLCPHFHLSLQSGCDRTLEADDHTKSQNHHRHTNNDTRHRHTNSGTRRAVLLLLLVIETTGYE